MNGSAQQRAEQRDEWSALCWSDLCDRLATLVKGAPPASAIPAARHIQRVFSAIELSKLAAAKRNGASDRENRRRASAGGTRSKKAASKASKRADTVEKNPDLADDVESGTLGDEQLDAIAHAAEKSDGDAATDEELIEDIKHAPPDEAGKIANRWLERRDDENGAQSRYERQRGRRGLRFSYQGTSGCEQMIMKGDRETMHEIRSLIRRAANELYEKDGGRELPADQHPRTRTQRMFDAAAQHFLGSHAGRSAPSVRSMLHIRLTVDDADADAIRAEAPGGEGLLPRSVLERHACLAELGLTVFDQQGRTLWHGRSERFATCDQYAALTARDGGCVLCSASPDRCVAHHLIPFGAPARGQTDIDELALLCDDCHHSVHDNDVILEWQMGPPGADCRPRRIWTTRPAEASERPPPHRRAA